MKQSIGAYAWLGLISFLFSGCHGHKENTGNPNLSNRKKPYADSIISTKVLTNPDLDTVMNPRKDTTFSDHNRITKLEEIALVQNTIYNFYINNQKLFTDTINGVFKREILDFDGDGNKDIAFTLFAPNGAQILYLFNKKENSFTSVKRFDWYTNPDHISTNRHIYFSYHTMGCADDSWHSDLFIIKDFEAFGIGSIETSDCGDTIEISKTINDKDVLMTRLSGKIINRYKDGKWGFITDYWAKNYSKFIRM